MLSRSSSVCSDQTVNVKSRVKPSENAMHGILSRHHVPSVPGSPDLIKSSFPHRVIGTLSYINNETKQFGVMVKLEQCDPESFVRSINDHYTKDLESDDEEEAISGFNRKTCKSVPKAAVVNGGIYVARIEKLDYQIVRVQVIGIDRSNMKTMAAPQLVKVLVMDYGMITDIYDTELMLLDKTFAEGKYQTRFALACQLPDPRLLNGAPFPKLENFNVGDHVEVYVLSEHEPCLAVFGSLITGPNAISRELFLYEIAPHIVDPFYRAINGNLSTDVEMYKGWASNNWMHSYFWTLVTLVSFEDLGQVAVRDVFASLRFLPLHQSINRSYRKPEFSQAMIADPANIYSGSPVIVYYMPMNSYIRGTVTSVHYTGNVCDIEALDIPNLTIYDVPATMVHHPSSVLLSVPPLVFYVNLMKGYDGIKRDGALNAIKEMLHLNAVANLKFSLEHNVAQLETSKNDSVNVAIENYLSQLAAEEVKAKPLSRRPSNPGWEDI